MSSMWVRSGLGQESHTCTRHTNIQIGLLFLFVCCYCYSFLGGGGGGGGNRPSIPSWVVDGNILSCVMLQPTWCWQFAQIRTD